MQFLIYAFFCVLRENILDAASEDLSSRTVLNIVPDYSNKSVLKTLLFLSNPHFAQEQYQFDGACKEQLLRRCNKGVPCYLIDNAP